MTQFSIIQLKNTRTIHSQVIQEILHNIFKRINNQFNEKQNPNELNKWIEIIHNIISTKINSVEEFSTFIKKNFPNTELYEAEIQQMTEIDKIDSFIDKILCKAHEYSYINEVIHTWANQSLTELEKILS